MQRNEEEIKAKAYVNPFPQWRDEGYVPVAWVPVTLYTECVMPEDGVLEEWRKRQEADKKK